MTADVERLVRDGRVAVLYSPGYGAGWSTWSSEHGPAMLFDPHIADIVDRGDAGWRDQARAVALVKYPEEYLGGIDDLCVAWLPQCTEFRINEHDGNESIELKEEIPWTKA